MPTLKRTILFIFVILSGSCSDMSRRESKVTSRDSIASKTGSTKDSITRVDIYFHPSFLNGAVLHLDRISEKGVFTVDTTHLLVDGKPGLLEFDLKDLETDTNVEFFWSSSRIYSVRKDTSIISFDGMSVRVLFTKNGIADSVDLGNSYPKLVDSLFLEQFIFLARKSKKGSMKSYLKRLGEYL